jgi:prepilin-type N-terminal cleavage/methylation domain-containing protein
MSILQKSITMRKAFTLMEMVVALGIMAIVLSFAGAIFRVSVDSHRLALANAELMQKFRAVTEQLDADFHGLRKDGEVLVLWRAQRKADYTGQNRNAEEAFERFDRIMFFADGDFQTYGTYGANNPKPIRGNMARICYALANGPSSNPTEPNRPQNQKAQRRVLARTEHILVPPSTTANPGDPLGMSQFTDGQWRDWMSVKESDPVSLRGWELIAPAQKADILSVIGDVEVSVDNFTSKKSDLDGGVTLDPANPQSLHAFLCRGVGQFEIQGWSDAERRWIPSVNPNGDASLTDDSDFVLQGDDLHPRSIPGLWYPRGPAIFGNRTIARFNSDFSQIPGLGRALKFTFTLYDSRGLVKNGRTFTHIVYLDN